MGKIVGVLLIVVLGVCHCAEETEGACEDIDTDACKLMEISQPDLCQQFEVAMLTCPRYCKLCPLKCYHCNGSVEDYHLCNETAICGDQQMCMLKMLNSVFDGHHEYEMTCEGKELCDGFGLTFGFGKRDLATRDLSVSCCDEDLCNHPEYKKTQDLTTTTTATSTSIPMTTTPAPSSTANVATTEEQTITVTDDNLTDATSTVSSATIALNNSTSEATVSTTSTVPTTISTTTITTTEVPTTTTPSCVVDLILVVDESERMMQYESSLKDFLTSLIDQLQISDSGTHVSLGLFSSSSREQFDLNDFTTVAGVEQAIRHIRFHGGSASIEPGLVYAIEAMSTSAGDRQGVENVVLIITADGAHSFSFGGGGRLGSLERQIHELSHDVILIELGHTNIDHLATDAGHEIHLRIFDDNALNKVISLICPYTD